MFCPATRSAWLMVLKGDRSIPVLAMSFPVVGLTNNLLTCDATFPWLTVCAIAGKVKSRLKQLTTGTREAKTQPVKIFLNFAIWSADRGGKGHGRDLVCNVSRAIALYVWGRLKLTALLLGGGLFKLGTAISRSSSMRVSLVPKGNRLIKVFLYGNLWVLVDSAEGCNFPS